MKDQDCWIVPNRIQQGMKLESDPTLIFALQDFKINRVLNKDKKVDSPYNI